MTAKGKKTAAPPRFATYEEVDRSLEEFFEHIREVVKNCRSDPPQVDQDLMTISLSWTAARDAMSVGSGAYWENPNMKRWSKAVDGLFSRGGL